MEYVIRIASASSPLWRVLCLLLRRCMTDYAWLIEKEKLQLVLNALEDLIEAVPVVHHHRTTLHWRAEQFRLRSRAGTHCAFGGSDCDTASIALEMTRREYEESRPKGEFLGIR